MDLLELVELEGGIEILINIEHQSTRLDTFKIRIIDEYKHYSKCKHKLPLLSVIVSPFKKEEHVSEYRDTASDVLQPIFITITDEEIEAEREYLAHKKEYDEDIESDSDYDYDDEPQTLDDLRAEDAAWEDDDFYLTKKNRHNKKKNRKR